MDTLLFSALVVAGLPILAKRKRGILPPVARRIPTTIVFGMPAGEAAPGIISPPITRTDDLFWLRDDERKSKRVIKHLEAENEYTMQETGGATREALREALYAEFRSRLKEADADVPGKKGSWLYFTRTKVGLSYGIHCRAPVGSHPAGKVVGEESVPGEQTLLDENALAAGNKMCDVHEIEVSPDGALCAYSIDFTGNEKYELRFKRAEDETGKDSIHDVIVDTSGEVLWGADSTTVYYSTLDEQHRPHKVWRHTLGAPQAADECVYTEDDERFWLGMRRSLTDDFIFIDSASKITSESWVLPLTPVAAAALGRGATTATPICFQERKENVLYEIDHYKSATSNLFVVLTNADGAKNFQVCVCPVSSTGSSDWAVLLKHDPAVFVTGVECFADYWAVSGREGGYKNIWLMPRTTLERALGSHAPITAADLIRVPAKHDVYVIGGSGGNDEYESNKFRFSYSSPISPSETCEVEVAADTSSVTWGSGSIAVLKQKEVPNYDATLYETKRIFATSHDGRQVPISLLYRPDKQKLAPAAGSTKSSACPLATPAPVLLYGYGSYGACMDMYFNASVLSLCDRGIVYAVAHIRGGSEMGRAWYEDEGKLQTKWNTFKDFTACADNLIGSGWADRTKIVAQGASAGGLLMGVVLNERPDLWAGILSQVGFVDVLATMSDESIPLTVTEYEEWGNPHEEAAYQYMGSYSPIDNVRRQAYPHVLLTAGLNDSRVAYWEPAKFAQCLREFNTSDKSTILLKTELVGGHFSFIDRYAYLRDKAFDMAWVVERLGAM